MFSVITFYVFSIFLSFTDFKRFLVPDILLATMSLIILIFEIINNSLQISSIVLSFCVLLFFILLLLIDRKMILGGGDIKYMMVIALYLGVQLFPYFLILTGILQSAFLLYFQNIKKRRVVAMVPIMFVAVLLVDYINTIYKLGF